MKKIRKEVELMASIQDCGNVIGLHGVYEDDAQVYVVMELCSGGDLERILEVSNADSIALLSFAVWPCSAYEIDIFVHAPYSGVHCTHLTQIDAV